MLRKYAPGQAIHIIAPSHFHILSFNKRRCKRVSSFRYLYAVHHFFEGSQRLLTNSSFCRTRRFLVARNHHITSEIFHYLKTAGIKYLFEMAHPNLQADTPFKLSTFQAIRRSLLQISTTFRSEMAQGIPPPSPRCDPGWQNSMCWSGFIFINVPTGY